jgi:alpha-amylase/alpha-mannosidase (GH57 family)
MRAFCVHGHFYQPPREDPISGKIPIEPGASPFMNWNERIDDQCYRPNARLGNFERISFNIGPTLFHWLEENDADTTHSIIAQERSNYERHGVGNAMAQAYNHAILPLLTRQDKFTQIKWGIAEFEFRFGHKPAGMWLPEAAVDNETLDVLEACDIQFTILAPWQADSSELDVTQPYWVSLPNNRRIAVFFYHQGLSTRVSFDPGATSNADHFLWDTIIPAFQTSSTVNGNPQLILVATDGELYGHHQPFRDKFLSYLMTDSYAKSPMELTYPGLWLRDYPPRKAIQIRQNTSWSCHHGLSRWSEECGCTPHSGWKAPLRKAMDQIGRLVDNEFAKFLSEYMIDPWQLRNEYIHVILGKMSAAEFINSMVTRKLDLEEAQQIELLLGAQYERQRMATSCGWYFEDFDRIEPRNNVAYAAQAVWLVYQATGVDISTQALQSLQLVRSWRSGVRADSVFKQHLHRAQETVKMLR